MENSISFDQGIKAALSGNNINNSYPWNHEEFVAGYKSINKNAKENLVLKELVKSMCPEEYKDLKL